MICEHCEELQEQVRQLEARVLGAGWEPPLEFRLTGHEAVILQALIAHDRTVPNWLLYEATRTAPNARGDDVDPKIVNVRISLLRTKLRRFGLSIITVWAQGYRLEPESRERLLNWKERAAA
jgi:two-component system cell cycle response regulator CtrA